MRGGGVYILLDADHAPLYIGQSHALDNRLGNHIGNPLWRSEIASMETIMLESARDRASVERELIRNLKPKYNKLFKNLPSDADMENLHFVWAPNWFYDGVRIRYALESDHDLAGFLGVTPQHVALVRMKMLGVSDSELGFVADKMALPIFALRKRLPVAEFAKKAPRIPADRVFRVPCISLEAPPCTSSW